VNIIVVTEVIEETDRLLSKKHSVLVELIKDSIVENVQSKRPHDVSVVNY